ncbi:hypothetical protein M080_7799, partial [Bacteroides fragilis str. 3397 T10]
ILNIRPEIRFHSGHSDFYIKEREYGKRENRICMQ